MVCQAVVPVYNRHPIHSTTLPDFPFQAIYVKFAGQFFNKKYVFIIVVEYSRFPIVEVINSTNFSRIKSFLKNTFSTFGIPKSLKSDNGPLFNIKEFIDFLASYKSPFHQNKSLLAGNCLVQRFVKTCNKSLKCA